MELQLDRKVAWITGGGEGIGRAIALLSAQVGAKVAVSGLRRKPLDDVVAKIEKNGGEALAVTADVSSPEQQAGAVDAIVQRWGRLDCVCANAGINGVWAPIDQLDPSDWGHTLAVNLTGTYLTAYCAVPHLKAAGGGSMVFISSVNGTRIFSNVGASAYATSKAGQFALGQMLALELAPHKVRVNVVCPGAIATGIHVKTDRSELEDATMPVEFPEGEIPLTQGEYGRPLEVARAVVFLFSDAASHITGTPLWIDGAESLLRG